MFTRERLTRWTKALRENPEEQTTDVLMNHEGKMCCLGKLCQVEGLSTFTPEDDESIYFLFPSRNGIVRNEGVLDGDLMREFGSETGAFSVLGMPKLYNRASAASANDDGCTWEEIADHFDKFYPCSDEQKEN